MHGIARSSTSSGAAKIIGIYRHTLTYFCFHKNETALEKQVQNLISHIPIATTGAPLWSTILT